MFVPYFVTVRHNMESVKVGGANKGGYFSFEKGIKWTLKFVHSALRTKKKVVKSINCPLVLKALTQIFTLYILH